MTYLKITLNCFYKDIIKHFNLKMTVFTVEYFNKIKDCIHPNLQRIVKDYQNGNLITLPPYHGCSHRNKNGTRKLIDMLVDIRV